MIVIVSSNEYAAAINNPSYITVSNDTLIYKDDGKGVPAESVKYLFERFYRVDKSRNRKSGGLGLGLAIVKEIVEAHGWVIKAENSKPSGLQFVIHFT